jgi:hypothetical protein
VPLVGCPGDCDGDGSVGIGELILAVRIALGEALVESCPSADSDGGGVSIGELIFSVRAALEGCQT